MHKSITLLTVLTALLIAPLPGFSQSTNTTTQALDLYQRGNKCYEEQRFPEAQEYYRQAKALMDPTGKEPVTTARQVAPTATTPSTQGSSMEYVLGENDVLHISVWQNPDMDQDAVVRPDGKISFPLIGDINAAGLTLTQMDNTITERLKEFIRRPEVSLSLTKIGGNKIMVLGAVNAAGVYSVSGAKTVLEAISLAQGFHRDAAISSVILIRGGLANPHAQRLNMVKALKGIPNENIMLQSEDVIFVPRKFVADLNYFLSMVIDPISKGIYTAKTFQTF